MHAVEWEKFRKDGDLAELQHPAATDFYCPEVTQLAKETIERNARENTKRSGTTANSCTSILAERARFTASLGRNEIPPSFQATRFVAALRERNASKSQVGQPSPNAALTPFGQAWTPLPRATARWGPMGRIVDELVENAHASWSSAKSITKLFTVSGKRKNAYEEKKRLAIDQHKTYIATALEALRKLRAKYPATEYPKPGRSSRVRRKLASLRCAEYQKFPTNLSFSCAMQSCPLTADTAAKLTYIPRVKYLALGQISKCPNSLRRKKTTQSQTEPVPSASTLPKLLLSKMAELQIWENATCSC